MDHAAETDVLTVSAGDTIEVAHVRENPEELGVVIWDNCPYERGSCVRFRGDDEIVSSTLLTAMFIECEFLARALADTRA
jgi:hypothetical protein